jgi:hypothetical protein
VSHNSGKEHSSGLLHQERPFLWSWPEPVHVSASPQLKINLLETLTANHYAAVKSTGAGGTFPVNNSEDLPPVEDGASKPTIQVCVSVAAT